MSAVTASGVSRRFRPSARGWSGSCAATCLGWAGSSSGWLPVASPRRSWERWPSGSGGVRSGGTTSTSPIPSGRACGRRRAATRAGSALERDHGVLARVLGMRAGHPAVTVEHHALVDDDDGRLDVAGDARTAPQLDALDADDVADDLAAHEDDAGADGGVDDALLTDDQRIVGVDLAAQPAVDHHRAAERELAFDLRGLVEERRELARVLAASLAVVLPHHGRRMPPAG